MAAEQRSLQDKGFLEATIKMILTTTAMYRERWKSFVSWCSERGENPLHASLKNVLDFLHAKFEALAVNTTKGYVTATV